jgi:putative transposase
MIRRQAYKFQLKTNLSQARQMRRFAGACRFVFNQALALQKAKYEAGNKKLSYADLCAELLTLKSSNPWLANLPLKRYNNH